MWNQVCENEMPESKASEVSTVHGKEILIRSSPEPLLTGSVNVPQIRHEPLATVSVNVPQVRHEALSTFSVNAPSIKHVPAMEELMCNQQSLWKANNELFREFLEYKKSKGG